MSDAVTLPAESDSLSDHRRREAAVAVAEPPPAAPVAEHEAIDIDPDTQAEIDALEPPKPEETPQEKGARTKRNRESATKARVTKLARARDAEKARADTLERELREIRTHGVAPAPAPAAMPAAQGQTFPKFDAWLADPANQAKDYDDYQDARVQHRLDQASLAARASQSRAAAESEAASLDAAHEARVQAFRATTPDYDAVVAATTFTPTEATLPTVRAVIEAMRRSDNSASLTYHFAGHRQEFEALMAKSPLVALVELGKVEARLAAPAAPPAVSHVPSAPPPHAPGGGSGPAHTPDVMKPGAALSDHRRAKAAELAASRR